MTYLQIILNLPINQPFTYSYIPSENEKEGLEPAIGKRAEIMFGNRKTTGFIVDILDDVPPTCPVEKEKIRPIKRILDKEPLFQKELIELAKWMSHYYLCTFGEAVFAMIPSGRRETSAGGFNFEEDLEPKPKNQLSDEQKSAVENVFNSFLNNQNNNSQFLQQNDLFHYIYGPTGTGKTEVFLSLAEKVLEQGKGVIYLVPEISLTGQVAKSIVERFGNTAAILHSGLTPSQKLAQWHKILHKEAKVIVGARSAIFAPVPDLGLIIIDEEHDGSYKSGTTPRYHARQVAMHRASQLKIPLIMGSATPSVEAWFQMNRGAIKRYNLTKRLAGGELPKVSCINLSNFQMDGCISKPLEEEIKNTLENKKQVILFLNRRGFTHFFSCNSCNYNIVCKNCSVQLTYHKNTNRLKCHYCGWSTTPPESCPQCGALDIGCSGFGTEYIEAETKAKFPNAKVLRLDTDAITKKEELLQKLEQFKNNEYDILLGTQMVAKGLNFPNLQLVGVILADAGLHMPDFRASERTFSLITQVAGRAGRYFKGGKVFVQTYNPYSEPILFACENRIFEYYENEISQRNMLAFPPFSRLIRLVFRSFDKKLAFETANDAAKILAEKLPKEAELFGPTECPIEKINSNWRYHILLKGSSIIPLQDAARNLLFNYTHNQNVYIEYDVDPTSLL